MPGKEQVPGEEYQPGERIRCMESTRIATSTVPAPCSLADAAWRVRESVTLVTALNPVIGYEKAALIAKTAIATGGAIDEVAESLGILTREQIEALLVPERLTQPGRLMS